jgi:hypothetical protein
LYKTNCGFAGYGVKTPSDIKGDNPVDVFAFIGYAQRMRFAQYEQTQSIIVHPCVVANGINRRENEAGICAVQIEPPQTLFSVGFYPDGGEGLGVLYYRRRIFALGCFGYLGYCSFLDVVAVDVGLARRIN